MSKMSKVLEIANKLSRLNFKKKTPAPVPTKPPPDKKSLAVSEGGLNVRSMKAAKQATEQVNGKKMISKGVNATSIEAQATPRAKSSYKPSISPAPQHLGRGKGKAL